jgi:hypothetical protein
VSDGLGTKLSRWSQRKHAARHGGALPEPAQTPAEDTGADRQATTQAEANAAPAATNAGGTATAAEEMPALPPIEELTAQSDYTVFLGKNVPEALTRAALRKLWLSDPVLANLDGLNDYCEDLNIVDTPITLAQTSYRAGKGYLDEAEEKAKEKLRQELLKAGDKPALAQSEQSPESESEPEAVPHDEAAADAPRRLAAGEPGGEPAKDSGET